MVCHPPHLYILMKNILFFAFIVVSFCVFSANQTHGAEADNILTFSGLYKKSSVLGLEFSEKLKALDGQEVIIRGFMAPPLKAEAKFFVLTKEPVALCPFCSSDADWPDNILVVYLKENQAFVQNNTIIEVQGVLEIGSFHDEETGFVSQIRLREAKFKKAG